MKPDGRAMRSSVEQVGRQTRVICRWRGVVQPLSRSSQGRRAEDLAGVPPGACCLPDGGVYEANVFAKWV